MENKVWFNPNKTRISGPFVNITSLGLIAGRSVDLNDNGYTPFSRQRQNDNEVDLPIYFGYLYNLVPRTNSKGKEE